MANYDTNGFEGSSRQHVSAGMCPYCNYAFLRVYDMYVHLAERHTRKVETGDIDGKVAQGIAAMARTRLQRMRTKPPLWVDDNA